MLDFAHMAITTLGVGGVAGLWLLKAALGIGALRLWRGWRARRRARGLRAALPMPVGLPVPVAVPVAVRGDTRPDL